MNVLKQTVVIGLGLVCGLTLGGLRLDITAAQAESTFTGWQVAPIPGPVKVGEAGVNVFYGGSAPPEPVKKCPNTPKDVPADADGCPLDSDGDGVPDYKDKCPNTPRGVKVDENGCSDSDGDGVTDDKDQCPNTPKGAKVDPRGCWVLHGLNFDTNKAVIRPNSTATLSEAIDVLKRNDGVKVTIQGHTDNVGSEKHNHKLAESRANAVKQYMIQHGIKKDRLAAVGFGANKPIADNKTEEGRAANRRVELDPASR